MPHFLMTMLGELVSFKRILNGMEVETTNGRLILTFLRPKIVRVKALRKGGSEPPPNPTVPERSWPPIQLEISRSDDHISISSPELLVRIRRSPLRIDLLDPNGDPINLDLNGISFEGGVTKASRRCEEDEGFFGFGLQFYSFNHRGKLRFLKVTADPKEDNGQSHVVVPFYMSTRGYGLLLNTASYSVFELGTEERPDEVLISVPGDSIDLFLIYGPSPAEILRGYIEITGKPAMPPKWGLGFWYRVKSEWKAKRVKEVMSKFREKGIPCDVIGLEPSWQTRSYPCSFVWNEEQFPDPNSFIKWAHQNGFKLNLWEHPYVHPSSPLYEKLKPHSADKEVWGGLVPDFSQREAREIFAEYHEKELVSKGIDGFKLDECDGSDYTGGWFFPDETRFPGGLTGAQMHNVFGFLYQETIHSIYRKLGRRTLLLCRGNFTGSHRYPTCAYSDLYDLRAYLRALVNSGFTATLWCPEVRGTDSPEEFIRRFQLTFFAPVSMINAWADGITPWGKGRRAERIFKEFAELRMRLIPYIYSAFWRAREEGVPVVRPLYLDFPEDPEVRSIDDQYMFGDFIMVAPVIEGEGRYVYLPPTPGGWIDFWTGERFDGGKRIDYSCPLERMPLFVKAGALLPLGPVMSYVGEKEEDELTIRIFPGADGRFELYEDDGISFAYERGERSVTRMRYEEGTEGWRLTVSAADGIFAGQPSSREITVERPSERQPSSVVLDGASIESWSFDPDSKLLKIGCGRIPVTRSMRLEVRF